MNKKVSIEDQPIENVFYATDFGVEGKKTKVTNPYNYDPITQYQTNVEPNGSLYTDRLLQWDYEKHNRICQEVFGNQRQYWGERTPAQIQEFLRKWTEHESLVLCSIVEYCNVATGYPVWYFSYKTTPKAA